MDLLEFLRRLSHTSSTLYYLKKRDVLLHCGKEAKVQTSVSSRAPYAQLIYQFIGLKAHPS